MSAAAVPLTLVQRLSTHLEYSVGHVIDVDDLAVGGIAEQAAKPVRKPTNEKMPRGGTGPQINGIWLPLVHRFCKGWLLQSIDPRVHEPGVIVEQNIGSENVPL